jgi:Zn ribbon nucleic-acid-binding protein
MVKYWRENSVKIVLYLDDGFGMNTDEKQCIKDSNFVRQSLLDAGFSLPSLFDRQV